MEKILSKLSLENSQLSKTLTAKEKVIDELHSIRAQMDYDLRAVVSRLESMKRENASLSYEVRVLEKELEIRNEEREFNRRTAEVAHKQYLGSVKKIAMLETEAKRLRMLVQKDAEITRRNSNPFPIASNDFIVDGGKKMNFLTQQMSAFQEENRLLREFLNKKASELSKSQTETGPKRYTVGASDMGFDEKVSMAESWAPSWNTVGASDIGLMDDFVEMEKLAGKKDADEVPPTKPSNELLHSGMNKSIQRLVELIERVRLSEKEDEDGLSYKPTGYTVHVFQWKTSELVATLEAFLQTCNKLLNGKVGVEDFAEELTSALEWIVNHCFSSMKENLESANMELEGKLQSECSKCESLTVELQESEKDVGILKTGEGSFKEQKEILKDLDKHPIDECEEAHEEREENDTRSNAKLDATHLKPESMTENDKKSCGLDHHGRTLQSAQEITAASEKLAECQETILKLGNQMKALASSPIDTCSSDQCDITVSPLNNNQQVSLLDKMIREDATGAPRSQKPKGMTRALTSPAILDGNGNVNLNPIMSPLMFVSVEGVKDEKDEEALVNFLSIVPNKKKSSSGGILSRLFFTRKKR